MYHPGFYQAKQIIFENVFPFLNEEQIFVCLVPHTDNVANVANLFLCT